MKEFDESEIELRSKKEQIDFSISYGRAMLTMLGAVTELVNGTLSSGHHLGLYY